MKVEELKFKEGRAVVELADGTSLSIINSERNDVIREAKIWSPSAIAGGWDITDVQASDGNYEVAILRPGGGSANVQPPEWDSHSIESDGWILFTDMPASLIETYADRVGVK